jgi:hypothetical protein
MQKKKPVMIYSVFINVRENRKDNVYMSLSWKFGYTNYIFQTMFKHVAYDLFMSDNTNKLWFSIILSPS